MISTQNKTIKSNKSSQLKTISQPKNQSYYFSEHSQKQSSNRNYNNSDIAQEILGLNQPNFMPSATFNPRISENTSKLSSYVHSQNQTDHRTLSVISILDQKNYQNSALELHKARTLNQNAETLKIQKLDSIGGHSINSKIVEPLNDSYLPQIVNVPQAEQRLSPFIKRIQIIQAQQTEKHLHLVSLVKMLGQRTKSVSQPQTPHLQLIKEQLEMIPETPKSITRSNSVKKMLARVEDTLKKAGISNVIKGIVTYHTTNQHQKPPFERLLRYESQYNQTYDQNRSRLEDFLSPKSLLTLKNPFKEPKYLQNINYHVHDKSRFEPDKETAELLCQQFVKSIMGDDFVDPSQGNKLQNHKNKNNAINFDGHPTEEQDPQSLLQTHISSAIRIQEKNSYQDPQVDLKLNNALSRPLRNQSSTQLVGDLTPRKLHAKIKVKPGQQVFSSAVMWNQQQRSDSPLEKTFVSQDGGCSPFSVVKVQPQLQDKTKFKQSISHATSGSSNFVIKPSQQSPQIHINLEDIDFQNENIEDGDQGELSPLGTESEQYLDTSQTNFKETIQQISAQAQVAKRSSKSNILNLAITNQQLFNKDIQNFDESPSPKNDLSPFGPKKSIIDKSDIYKRNQEQKQQLLFEGKSPQHSSVRRLQNQSLVRGLSLINTKNSPIRGQQITRELSGNFSPQSPRLQNKLSKNSILPKVDITEFQEQSPLNRPYLARFQSSLNVVPPEQQTRLNLNFENQLGIKTGGMFGQITAQDKTLQNIVSQSQLSADTKSLYSGDVSPRSDMKQSGLPSSYNGNNAEMELTTLAALENVQPDRIEIKIGQNNYQQQLNRNTDIFQIKKQEPIAFKLMQLVPDRDSKIGMYSSSPNQTNNYESQSSNIKKSPIRKVISFQERNIHLQKLVVNTQASQALQSQTNAYKIPETPLTIEGTPTQQRRPDQDSSSAIKRVYGKFGRLQSDKNMVIVKRDQKGPADLRILDRFAESAVVEEIQPWEENQKGDFQYSSDEDDFIPSSQIQAEVSSAMPKQTRNKAAEQSSPQNPEAQINQNKSATDVEQDQK